jgi:kynurenine formamidase
MPRLVDLSYPIKPHWRWPVEVERVKAHERGDAFQSSVARISLHAYTHTDAPVHFQPGGRTHDQTPLDQFIGRAWVVDLTHRGADEGIMAEDLEAKGQRLVRGDIALLRTDWPLKRSIDSKEFWLDAPFTTRGACEWLVARGVKTVGYDYPPDEPLKRRAREPDFEGAPEDNTTHFVFFPAGVYVIEYLANLHELPTDRPVQLIGLPIRMYGTDGAPARVIARVD